MRDSGVDLSGGVWIPASAGMTKDIDGNTRSPSAGSGQAQGPAWDIGADEDAASNPDYRFNGWFTPLDRQ